MPRKEISLPYNREHNKNTNSGSLSFSIIKEYDSTQRCSKEYDFKRTGVRYPHSKEYDSHEHWAK
jgi:hypothetical protein